MTTNASEIIEDATPERIAFANDNFTLTADGARQFQDELLLRLGNKGQLYPNAAINTACKLAGERYYEDWYGSNMGGLQAIDYGKVQGGQGGSGSHMPVSHRQAQMRDSYRKARAVLGAKYRVPLELILLDGQSDLVAIGRKITGASSPHTCRAVAIERFTAGLYLLSKHYGFAV
jgi:hypothetical protein